MFDNPPCISGVDRPQIPVLRAQKYSFHLILKGDNSGILASIVLLKASLKNTDVPFLARPGPPFPAFLTHYSGIKIYGRKYAGQSERNGVVFVSLGGS